MHATDKHAGLFRAFVNYGRNKFITLTPDVTMDKLKSRNTY